MRPAMKYFQKGAAVTEFALVLPLLLILTFITTEFGRALYEYNTLTKSVRDAARYLSVRSPQTNITEAKNLVIYGNTAGYGNPLVAGITVSNVPDPVWSSSGSFPVVNTVTVSVTNYGFRSIVPGAFSIGFGNLTFSPIRATMRSPS